MRRALPPLALVAVLLLCVGLVVFWKAHPSDASVAHHGALPETESQEDTSDQRTKPLASHGPVKELDTASDSPADSDQVNLQASPSGNWGHVIAAGHVPLDRLEPTELERCVFLGSLELFGPKSLTKIEPGTEAQLTSVLGDPRAESTFRRRALLDFDGNFRILVNEPGAYTLTIRSRSYTIGVGSVQITEGEQTFAVGLELTQFVARFPGPLTEESTRGGRRFLFSLCSKTDSGLAFTAMLMRPFDSDVGEVRVPAAVGQAIIGKLGLLGNEFLRNPARLPELEDEVWSGQIPRGEELLVEFD